jgi:hypothetical protein
MDEIIKALAHGSMNAGSERKRQQREQTSAFNLHE